MSESVTIADIYQLFRTSAEEFDRRLRESDRRIEQARLESDRRIEQAKLESDRRIEQAKLESDRTIAELKRTVEQTNRAVNSLTTRWGRFVEELVQPAVLRLFQEKGIDIKEIYPRARVKRQGIAMEIDILAVDDTDVVLVECKSRLSKDDVDEFLEKLTRFKIAFPHYKNYQAYGAVAGIEIDEGIDRYAYNKGLFVIKPSGDTVEIINDENFRPRTW
ncbi:MAG: DUF3782 domain-containing protein [Microcystis aeruginosa Ma_QC_Ca_00000000_S207]|jgi:hypothetical protein|uniref:DUF3782 domain-containing protein n=1 Tax=Microcystis aeruginosa Ma_QC_Ca_00000000_S207 TaxID=2486251 RepID=A0A552G0E2_MICAE|nr:DUF3782 domain-containing protein [Microcystis aeruginosa W13-18]NCR35641.1 DUF3782 domain-containing protein [Microcystis aeruginosa S11-05]NCR49134.1 DUF3782 domain-containing protein [Microcystis aeruginosa S11-01]NCS38796.1 DUF3782 domain-containing protein [Microcystis aeruginosa BS13-10]NCS47409.1 DUF3782 domain-containing protein [Microcystis aeruginosa BK11-02]NCS76841.1 DUF3782 domain-containing protein [Microcystis aeruginosa K13-07]NCT44166.1 DUF3782 domain-containing protein [M